MLKKSRRHFVDKVFLMSTKLRRTNPNFETIPRLGYTYG